MKLGAYIKTLQQMVKENPELKNYEVVYSADDEGNQFQVVYFSPTVGQYKDGEFMTSGDLESFDMDSNFKNNAVCIN
jgi:hypothetical protein